MISSAPDQWKLFIPVINSVQLPVLFIPGESALLSEFFLTSGGVIIKVLQRVALWTQWLALRRCWKTISPGHNTLTVSYDAQRTVHESITHPFIHWSARCQRQKKYNNPRVSWRDLISALPARLLWASDNVKTWIVLISSSLLATDLKLVSASKMFWCY